jgi:hypothetical protein
MKPQPNGFTNLLRRPVESAADCGPRPDGSFRPIADARMQA